MESFFKALAMILFLSFILAVVVTFLNIAACIFLNSLSKPYLEDAAVIDVKKCRTNLSKLISVYINYHLLWFMCIVIFVKWLFKKPNNDRAINVIGPHIPR